MALARGWRGVVCPNCLRGGVARGGCTLNWRNTGKGLSWKGSPLLMASWSEGTGLRAGEAGSLGFTQRTTEGQAARAELSSGS